MANFCVKCGGALDANAGFCRQCGSPVPAGQPPVQTAAPSYNPVYNNPPPAAPSAKSGSALKFLLIAFLLFAVLGVAALVGVYYYAKSKVIDKMAEFKEQTGVDVGAALEKAARGKPSSGARRDGCLMLTRQEAERILGMPLERVDSGPRTNASEEHCDYYAPAAAAKVSAEQAAERFKELGKSDSGDLNQNLKKLEGVVKTMGASMNDGTTPILVVTIYRGDAQAAVMGLNLGVALGGVKPEKVAGPWDEAVLGPLNSLMTVRKGDNGFMIDLRQLPEGREKGLEIAKTIIEKF
jgi:hypothetical protein